MNKELATGTTLSHYRIVSKIGAGAQRYFNCASSGSGAGPNHDAIALEERNVYSTVHH
jgi:hypothetical protein